MNSSDCVANENEWRDSEGKRERSSPNTRVGEPGADGADPEGCLETGGVAMFKEVARCVVGCSRPGGCCRMRRSPEAPMPCSCSGTIGDLKQRRESLVQKGMCLHSHLPHHAIQLSSIDAHPLGSVYGRGCSCLGQQVRGAFVLNKGGIVRDAGRLLFRQGIEVFW